MGWWNKLVRDKMEEEKQERYHDYILRKLREEREKEAEKWFMILILYILHTLNIEIKALNIS